MNKMLRTTIKNVSFILSLTFFSCATGQQQNSADSVSLDSFQTVSHHSGEFVKEQVKRLGKGINMGNALDATPDEKGWGNPIDLHYFELMKKAGFDNVRIPIRWSLPDRTELTAPYAISVPFFQRVDEVVSAALKSGLMVIVNVHHYVEEGHDINVSPEREASRFLAIWTQLAEHFKSQSTDILFELLNEPNANLTSRKWNSLSQSAVSAIRAVDRKHTIIIGGIAFNDVGTLKTLALPDDENVIATFHFYGPFGFTHQGAAWVNPTPALGVLWPNRAPDPVNTVEITKELRSSWLASWYTAYNGTGDYPGDPNDIRKQFDSAEYWSQVNDCPLYLGEFGSNSTADPDSRIRWTTYIRKQAQRIGAAYSYWEFSAGFGVYDKEKGSFRSELLKAVVGN